ncbi:hypothetical protein V8G54_024967 [Vigna mungo]|uniref:Secreted protein n=1 Tax=Vigna mungo TaxID=3915 RepID=A0AAQ3N896_VIGMU
MASSISLLFFVRLRVGGLPPTGYHLPPNGHRDAAEGIAGDLRMLSPPSVSKSHIMALRLRTSTITIARSSPLSFIARERGNVLLTRSSQLQMVRVTLETNFERIGMGFDDLISVCWFDAGER